MITTWNKLVTMFPIMKSNAARDHDMSTNLPWNCPGDHGETVPFNCSTFVIPIALSNNWVTQGRATLGNTERYFVMGHPTTLRWRQIGRDNVSNHQPHDCLLNRLFKHRSKKTSKLRVTGLCAGNSPGAGEFPAQMASNAENVSIWWRHHEMSKY